MTDDRAESPLAAAVAFAPALVGAVSLLLGLAVFRFLARTAGPPEEAAVRLFGLIFLAIGIALINYGAGAILVLAARRRGRGPAKPPVALLAFTTVSFIALIAPLHLWWQAPWPAFRTTVLVLDLVAIALIVRLIARLVGRRRTGATTLRQASAAAHDRLTLAAFIFGVSGLLVGWLGGQEAVADWRGWSALRSVQGQVLRQHSFNFRDPERGLISMGAAVVQYSVDGKGFEATLPMDPASPLFRRGATVELLYDRAQPGGARLASAFEAFLLAGVLLVTAVSFLGIAAVALVRANR